MAEEHKRTGYDGRPDELQQMAPHVVPSKLRNRMGHCGSKIDGGETWITKRKMAEEKEESLTRAHALARREHFVMTET